MIEAMRIAVVACLLGVLLTGCGVRGSLDLPPEAQQQSDTAQADSGQGKPAGDAPKPHKPFILDGLIR